MADAEEAAKGALARANASVRSQLEVFQTLAGLKKAIERDAPQDPRLGQLEALVKDRAKLMRDVANQTVKLAGEVFRQQSTDEVRAALVKALQTAHDVYSVVSPKSSRLKTLKKRAGEIGARLGNDAAQVRPFFARFLEDQNRGQAAQQVAPQEVGPEQLTTEKYPSDVEDAGPL